MGIKGLWGLIDSKGCCHEVPTHYVRDLIRTDKCRVCCDAFHMCYKYFSSEWLKAAPEGYYDQQVMLRGAIGRFLELADIFRSSRMEMVLCVDGDKSKDKLATAQRTDTREENYREVIKLYLECKELLKDNTNDEDPLNVFRFLENYTYVIEPSSEAPLSKHTENTLSTGQVLSANIAQMRKLLKSTVFYPKRFIDKILDELVANGITVCGVPAISEGEKLCSILCKLGYCQAVYSGDSDSVVLGTRCIIRSITKNTSTVYFYEEILDRLKMDDKQFLSMCIGIGSDYSLGAPGLGPVKCDAEVRKPDFDLQKFNLAYCGVPRVNICVRAFRISANEMDDVMNNLTFRAKTA